MARRTFGVRSDDTLEEKLAHTRDGYAAELRTHKFLLDAFAATGGFSGRERADASSYWGPAADMYADARLTALDLSDSDEASLDTYLDRHPREDMSKFRRRVQVAHYSNYCEPVIDIRLSYMNRKPFARALEALTPLSDWMQDVDNAGSTWDALLRGTVQQRAAVLGWCPVLFDLPLPGDVAPSLTMAQAQTTGAMRVRALPLFPAHVLDWDEDDETGMLRAIKLCLPRCERDDILEPGRIIRRYQVWDTARVRVFDTVVDDKGKEQVVSQTETAHPFGAVPVVIFRGRPLTADPVRGQSLIHNVAWKGRRLFNLLSELDEHLRGSTFAFLQVPTDDIEKSRGYVLGTGNALPVKGDWMREFKWISPDASVASVYENRIVETITEMYRLGRMEFTRATGGAAVSAASRAFEFETANRSIADFASGMANAEQEALRLVATVLSRGTLDARARMSIRVTSPERFDIEQMTQEIADAIDVVTKLGLGSIANGEIKKRLAHHLLANLDEQKLVDIDEEIESDEKDAKAAESTAREASAAGFAAMGDPNAPQDANAADNELLTSEQQKQAAQQAEDVLVSSKAKGKSKRKAKP